MAPNRRASCMADPLVTRTGVSFIVSGTGQAKQFFEAKRTRKAQKPQLPHMEKLTNRNAFLGIYRFGQCGVDVQDSANSQVGFRKLAFCRPH